jgi:hypothetical protein
MPIFIDIQTFENTTSLSYDIAQICLFPKFISLMTSIFSLSFKNVQKFIPFSNFIH